LLSKKFEKEIVFESSHLAGSVRNQSGSTTLLFVHKTDNMLVVP
jgi:hypothetical protein